MLLKTRCKADEKLNFLERKLLNLLDIELSNKNPDVIFSISCMKPDYSFRFFNGILEVEQNFSTKEELFKRLASFRESLKYFECDFSGTGFLDEHGM